jgi:hypothetical protein
MWSAQQPRLHLALLNLLALATAFDSSVRVVPCLDAEGGTPTKYWSIAAAPADVNINRTLPRATPPANQSYTGATADEQRTWWIKYTVTDDTIATMPGLSTKCLDCLDCAVGTVPVLRECEPNETSQMWLLVNSKTIPR